MSIQEASQQLRKAFEKLIPIPDEEWNFFQKTLSERSFPKGGTWVEIGSPADSIGFIQSGLVRVFYVLQDGTEYTRNFRYEGQFVASYAAALQNEVSKFAISCLEDTTLTLFPYRAFQEGFERHPCWQAISRKLVDALYINYQQREYELLCLDAEARYESFQKEFQPVRNRISQTMVANYLGITPVSLSRLLGNKHRAKKS